MVLGIGAVIGGAGEVDRCSARIASNVFLRLCDVVTDSAPCWRTHRTRPRNMVLPMGRLTGDFREDLLADFCGESGEVERREIVMP